MLFNPKLQDTSGSSVTQQTAVSQPNIVGGIADAVSQVSSIFTKVNKAEEEGASAGFMRSYTQELTRIAARVQQDPSFTANNGSSEAQRAYTKALTHPLAKGNAKAMGDVYNQINGITGSFKAFETPEQQIYNKLYNSALEDNIFSPTDTQEQINKKLKKYGNQEALLREIEVNTKDSEYLQSRLDANSKRLAKEAKEKTYALTVDYVDTQSGFLKSQMQNIVSDYGAGKYPLASAALEQIDLLKANFLSKVTKIGSRESESVDRLMKPIIDLTESYKKSIIGEESAEALGNAIKIYESRAKLVLMQDPEIANFVAQEDIYGSLAVAIAPLNRTAALLGVKLSVKSKEGDAPLPSLIRNENQTEIFEYSNNVNKAAYNPRGGENSTELKEQDAVINNNILKNLSDNEGSIDGPTDVGGFVNHFSGAEFQKFVASGQMTPEYAASAIDVLKLSYGDDLMTAVKQNLDTTFKTLVGSVPFSGDIAESIKDLVEIEYNENGVVFKAKTGVSIDEVQISKYNRMIKKLNDTVGVKFNTYSKATSNLIGEKDYKNSAQTIFESQVLPFLGKSYKTPEEEVGNFSVERFLDNLSGGNIDVVQNLDDLEERLPTTYAVVKGIVSAIGDKASEISNIPFAPEDSIISRILSHGRKQAPKESSPNIPTESLRTPNLGDVEEGWRFMGGDPSDKNNWEKK